MTLSKVYITVHDRTNNNQVGTFCFFAELGSVLDLNKVQDDELREYMIRFYTYERIGNNLRYMNQNEIAKTTTKYDSTPKGCRWFCRLPGDKYEYAELLIPGYVLTEKNEFLIVHISTRYKTEEYEHDSEHEEEDEEEMH